MARKWMMPMARVVRVKPELSRTRMASVRLNWRSMAASTSCRWEGYSLKRRSRDHSSARECGGSELWLGWELEVGWVIAVPGCVSSVPVARLAGDAGGRCEVVAP